MTFDQPFKWTQAQKNAERSRRKKERKGKFDPEYLRKEAEKQHNSMNKRLAYIRELEYVLLLHATIVICLIYANMP